MGSTLWTMIDRESPEVAARLEAGESLASVAETPGVGAVGVIAAIARVGLGEEGSIGPGLVQTWPAHPKLVAALTEPGLTSLFPRSNRANRLALLAGLLQILDAWDASHAAAQTADDLDSQTTAAYWHLIAHRREPDPGNALYWARRVGRHPIHAHLARNAPEMAWTPAAMIDLATKARPGTSDEAQARRIQRAEMVALLECSWAAVSGEIIW